MTRTEHDLRAALRKLEQRADQHGAPSTADILAATTAVRRHGTSHRAVRWLAPLAAAALVAAAAVVAVTLNAGHRGSSGTRDAQPGARQTGVHAAAPTHTTAPVHHAPAIASAAGVLDDAAARLDHANWAAPAASDFFYVRTTQATTWTSASGRQAGDGRASDGTKIWISGCRHGQLVGGGASGACTLNDVPHYLADAPTTPSAWDGYLEHMVPGSKAAGAQGKFIVQVLHEDLVAPKAAAALLRYTASCPGLHTLKVRPVGGEKLIGVTCTSMTNGSYGLVFDPSAHAFVGFVGVTEGGSQDGPAEIVRTTGIVPAIGRTR
jgi:hypothetical protein